MPRVYTVRFGGAVGAPGTPISVFTALEGFVWVLRDLVVFIATSTATTITVNLIAGGSALPLWIVAAATSSTHHLDLRQVIQPGESLSVDSPTAAFTIVLTGYMFEDVASISLTSGIARSPSSLPVQAWEQSSQSFFTG